MQSQKAVGLPAQFTNEQILSVPLLSVPLCLYYIYIYIYIYIYMQRQTTIGMSALFTYK